MRSDLSGTARSLRVFDDFLRLHLKDPAILYLSPVFIIFLVSTNCAPQVVKATTVNIKGYDKVVVGQFAADIRFKRPPEPYKGKGVRYQDEFVPKKEGKRGKK